MYQISHDPCVHLSCRRSNTRRWPNVEHLLAHRLRRWANISPVLGYCVVFDAPLNVGQRHRRRAKIKPGPMSSIQLKVYSLKERRYIRVYYAELDGPLDPLITRG